MATSNGELNVSSGARSALRRAMSVLEGYGSEDPRIGRLIEQLGAIESPEDMTGDADGHVSVEKRAALLVRIQKAQDAAAAAGELTTEDRMQNARATRKAQLDYLAAVSPSAAASVQRESVYDGVRRGELPWSMARRIIP